MYTKDEIIFKNKAHADAYYSALSRCDEYRRDSYRQALFYLLALSEDTRIRIDKLYDFNWNCICPENVGEWVTSGSSRICNLAFNLFNGRVSEYAPVDSTPYELFSGVDGKYLVQGIILRYPWCFKE